MTANTPQQPASHTVTDSLGRSINVLELGALQLLDLFEAAGDNGNTQLWLGMAMQASAVTEIDGIPVPFPRNRDDIRAAVKRLGTEGLAAVRTALSPAETQATETVAGN